VEVCTRKISGSENKAVEMEVDQTYTEEALLCQRKGNF
jgi:hypothetical protein